MPARREKNEKAPHIWLDFLSMSLSILIIIYIIKYYITKVFILIIILYKIFIEYKSNVYRKIQSGILIRGRENHVSTFFIFLPFVAWPTKYL